MVLSWLNRQRKQRPEGDGEEGWKGDWEGRSLGGKERIGIGTGCLSSEFQFGGITGNMVKRTFQVFSGTVLLNISDITPPT